MQSKEWLGIAYVIPATPSRSRVFVWRKLKTIGAQIVKPGLAVLPNTKKNIKIFEELEKKIEEFSGESIVLQFNFLNSLQENTLNQKFKEASESKYRSLLTECKEILKNLNNENDVKKKKRLQHNLLKTIKNYQKINSDSITSQTKKDMEKAASEILQTLKQMPTELKSIFKKN